MDYELGLRLLSKQEPGFFWPVTQGNDMHGACGRSCALILYLAFVSGPQGPHVSGLHGLKHKTERRVVVLKPASLSP